MSAKAFRLGVVSLLALAAIGTASVLPAEAAQATAVAKRCKSPSAVSPYAVQRLRATKTTCRVARTLSARWFPRNERCAPIDGGDWWRTCDIFGRGIRFRCYAEITDIGSRRVECEARGARLVAFTSWP